MAGAEPCSGIIFRLVDCALPRLKKELIYICCFRSFIATLVTLNINLGAVLSDLQVAVDTAKGKGEEIMEIPRRLLLDMGSKMVEATELIGENSVPKTCCWNFIGDCNCKHRRAVAKKAETLANEMKALIEAGDKAILEKVSKMPRSPALGPTLAIGYKDLASREQHLKTLKKALLGDKKVVIGVYGEAKVGKTMLVEKLAKDMEFEKRFQHIVIISSNKGVFYTQKQIAERIGFELPYETLEEKKRMLNRRLASIGKDVLIIADDVDDNFNFNDIGIPTPSSNADCRIVVVSRTLKVCKRMKTRLNLEVKPFSIDEIHELDLMEQSSELPDVTDQTEQNLVLPDDILSQTNSNSELPDGILYQNNWNSELPDSEELKSELSGEKLDQDQQISDIPSEILDQNEQISELPREKLDQKRRNSEEERDGNIFLDAQVLDIANVNNPRFWRWELDPSTNRPELKLIVASNLHIERQLPTTLLDPNSKYVVYLVYKLAPVEVEAFKTNEVQFTVDCKSKSCYLDPSKAASLLNRNLIEKFDVPTERDDDGWMQIEMGRFSCYEVPKDGLYLCVNNLNHNSNDPTGLSVRGIELRLDGVIPMSHILYNIVFPK